MIYIAGTPRSGSTWCFEVAVELNRRNRLGHLVHKQHVLDKRHFDAVLDGELCITSTRLDIDAVVASYYGRPKAETEEMSLTRYELIEMTCDSIKQSYLLPGLHLTHQQITHQGLACVRAVCRYLGVDEAQADDVHDMFTKDKVQAGGVGRMFQKPGHITEMAT